MPRIAPSKRKKQKAIPTGVFINLDEFLNDDAFKKLVGEVSACMGVSYDEMMSVMQAAAKRSPFFKVGK